MDSTALTSQPDVQASAQCEAKAEVSANAPYAVDQEFGNSKIEERPFMRPAVRNTAAERAQIWGQLAASLARGG